MTIPEATKPRRPRTRKAKPEETTQEEKTIIRPLSQQDLADLYEVSCKLDYEKIRRIMMLFDIRWISEDFTSYIPEEKEIHQFAHQLLGRTVITGRIQGVASLRDRGFSALYSRNHLGGEVVGLQYIVSEASNLG